MPQRQSEDRRRIVEVPESAQIDSLDLEQRQAWKKAVEYYREHITPKPLLFDRGLIALRGDLSSIACSGVEPDHLDAELKEVLDSAMVVYRDRWWPGHRLANLAWIGEQVDRLRGLETTMATRLARAYGGKWPAQRIRTDITAYSNWAGAYTTNNPNLPTISSIDYPGLEGLEILFHEISHASFFEQRILGQVAAAFRAREARPPNRFVHTLQFLTPAELLRSLLDEDAKEQFDSVGVRVLERGSGKETYRMVLKHWKRFLDGTIERAEALDLIVRELSEIGS